MAGPLTEELLLLAQLWLLRPDLCDHRIKGGLRQVPVPRRMQVRKLQRLPGALQLSNSHCRNMRLKMNEDFSDWAKNKN